MALLSSRSDGRDYAKGALEPNVAGDQWSEKQNTGGRGFYFQASSFVRESMTQWADAARRRGGDLLQFSPTCDWERCLAVEVSPKNWATPGRCWETFCIVSYCFCWEIPLNC